MGILLLFHRNILQNRQLEKLERQLRNQTEQLNNQQNQRIDDRFNDAITLLGSAETSARTGGLYSLYYLATEHEKYTANIIEILCSHIRSKTQENDYKEQHKQRPSNEVQTAIDLLCKGKITEHFTDVTLSLNLQYAYLRGADFRRAWCQGADFSSTECQGADFTLAKCQKVSFRNAQYQGADFIDARCQGADFAFTKCQGAYFKDPQYQVAYEELGTLLGLKERIGKDTYLEEAIIFAGPIAEDVIQAIEAAKEFCNDEWRIEMEDIIQENDEAKQVSYTLPVGIVIGVLEDSEELQLIIKKDWEGLKRYG